MQLLKFNRQNVYVFLEILDDEHNYFYFEQVILNN